MSPKYDSLRKADPRKVLKFIAEHRHNPPELDDWSYREIGEKFNISATRVQQIERGKR